MSARLVFVHLTLLSPFPIPEFNAETGVRAPHICISNPIGHMLMTKEVPANAQRHATYHHVIKLERYTATPGGENSKVIMISGSLYFRAYMVGYPHQER